MDAATSTLRGQVGWSPGSAGTFARGRLAAGFRRLTSAAEDPVWIVLAVWAACGAALFAWIQRDAIALPFCDEYCFVSVACGQQAVTPEWLWLPANEHRAPLLRLYLAGLGKLTDWDFRVPLKVNLLTLIAGVLALVLAVRAARGRSILADAFLPLVALSPAGYATIVLYAYAYEPVVGWFFFALALLLSGSIYRSVWAGAVYASIAAALALAGGPAGQMWALALLTATPFVWQARAPGWARYRALAAALAIGGLVALLFYATPHQPAHDALRAADTSEFVDAAFKHSFGWLGLFPLQMFWDYLGVAALIPVIYVLARSSIRLAAVAASRRGIDPVVGAVDSWSDVGKWLPIAAVVAVTLVLCAVLGYTRGASQIWTSRYHFMIVPLPIATYLLLVHFRASSFYVNLLLIIALFAQGWNWPKYQEAGAGLRGEARMPLIWYLRAGYHPLTQLAEAYADKTGWNPAAGSKGPVTWWLDLRDSRMSAFRKLPPDFFALAIPSAAGELGPGLQLTGDPEAIRDKAIEVVPGSAEGRVVFRFEVPSDRKYQVWARCRDEAGEWLEVRVDDGPIEEVALGATGLYRAVCLGSDLPLAPGKHTLEIKVHSEKTRVDLIEVVAQP